MTARDLATSSSRRLAASSAASSRSAAPSGRAVPAALAGRYRSLFVIGRGGMGTVEAALEVHRERDVGETPEAHDYDRVVALKRLLPEARDARRVEMFLREARLAAMLDHPNVVRAFDYGETDGELFLAMEYVEGQALSRVLRALAEAKVDLGVPLTAHVLSEVCEGLHAAHELRDEKGQALALVHRDVSPQNVMLAYDGHVRLLDFGVAKIEAESVTKTGEVKGKTAYMSPEQAMGDPLDRRSDLFGVGAVLFECLTLRRMWGDGTDMDVIRKLALEEPPRLEDNVPSAPAELRALYMRLVARDASGRPATAKDVAVELRALVPQGREAASKELHALLEKHFGEQAEERRHLLRTSLEEAAPEQARELRESVSPDLARQPPTAPPHDRTASVTDATGKNPVSSSGTGVGTASPDSRAWVWLTLGAIVAALLAWRVSATPSSPLISEGVSASASTAPATAGPSATASAVPAPSATSSASAGAAAPSAAAPSASARGLTAPSSLRRPSSPPSTPRPPRTPTTVRPSASQTPLPDRTPKPPPDVDDHPF